MQGQNRILTWAKVVAIAMGAAVFALWVHHHTQPAETLSTAAQESTYWSVTYTGGAWRGKPVYRLTNRSGLPLSHITVYSWSEELLPVLYVGPNPPANWGTTNPLNQPPYTLAPGESLYIPAPGLPPARFTVMWRHGAEATYANLRTP